jgi:hypothetical protein
MQRIGITDVTVTYCRPAVNERKIWGGLVPFNKGKPFPWRAGANENTTISFTHDVKLNGQALPAGDYGFHIIPSATEWILIFSNNSTSFGSFFYNAEEDALRLSVTPKEAVHQERLLYGFEGFTTNSADCFLHWEQLKVSFKIEVDVHNIVIADIENQLKGGWGFFSMGYRQAANYCLQAETHYDKGLEWINRAIQMERTFRTLMTKGQILAKMGDVSQAKEILMEAKELAPKRLKKRIQKMIDEL